MSKPLGQEVGEVLVRETLKADPAALARLMADHTQVGRLGVCLVQLNSTVWVFLSAGFLYLQRLQRDERCSPGVRCLRCAQPRRFLPFEHSFHSYKVCSKTHGSESGQRSDCATCHAHAQLDWRPLLPHIRVPCLNLIGEVSGVFPEAGCRVVGELIPNCHTVRPFD